MNLLYTATGYPPSTGGAQLLHHLIAQELKVRHTIQVVSQWDSNRTDWLLGTTIRAPTEDRIYTIDGVNVHRFGLGLPEKVRMAVYLPMYYPLMRAALPRVSAFLKERLREYAAQSDLIHNVRIGREIWSYASFRAARERDIPFVLTPVHHPRWVGWRYRMYLNLYCAADGVIALTNAEKETLIRLGIRPERITVTGMGPVIAEQACPERFLEEYGIDGPVVLFLGQHYQYKGYQHVLRAAQIVWQRLPETHFVFIGPPVGRSEKHFQAFADQRIHRLGRVDLQKKTDALAACTLLCMPSAQESFGGVYTEAWSFGKPVIGCNIPSVAEVIADGVDGYLVAQEPAEIADRICDLLLHSGRSKAMGAAGRCKVEAKYTWAKIAEQIERAYQRACYS